MRRDYELGFILNPEVSEEQTSAILERIEKIVKNYDGQVVKVNQWGRRRLAYGRSAANLLPRPFLYRPSSRLRCSGGELAPSHLSAAHRAARAARLLERSACAAAE